MQYSMPSNKIVPQISKAELPGRWVIFAIVANKPASMCASGPGSAFQPPGALSAEDFKAGELFVVHVLDGHLLHLRPCRSLPAPADKFFYLQGGAGGYHFHRPFIGVPDPAGDTQLVGGFFGGSPVKYTLDFPFDKKMFRRHQSTFEG